MGKDKKSSEQKSTMKVFMCFIYLVIITFLFVCSYHIFLQKEKILPWSLSESTGDYTYMDLSKMSEKFAYYEESNMGLHFGIEEEKTGLWHAYIVAIDEDQYEKYKALIDYTYERTEKKPDKVRVYGYPVLVDDNIKDMVLKNVVHFLPAENEVEITEENYEKYFTNSYLDTTREREEEFNVLLCGSLFLLFIVIVLFFLTIFDKKKASTKVEE
ncbi:MAG: hypothetical protein IJI60_03055 [Bacilli bacterium]|nr:hypothetical protein [Bacilli bacterium]